MGRSCGYGAFGRLLFANQYPLQTKPFSSLPDGEAGSWIREVILVTRIRVSPASPLTLSSRAGEGKTTSSVDSYLST